LPPFVRTSHKKNDGGKGGGPGTDFREKAVKRRAAEEKAALCGSLRLVCAGEAFGLKNKGVPARPGTSEHGIAEGAHGFDAFFFQKGKRQCTTG